MWEDEVRIPPPGYRSAPQRRAAEARRMMVAIGGVGAALLLCVVGYFAETGGGAESVPVIQAPSGSVKVKPDDPGGLQVNTQTSALLGSNGSGSGANLAPAPEVPDPAALAAAANQELAPLAPVPVAPTVVSGPPPAAPPAAAPSVVNAAPTPAKHAAIAPAVSVPSVPETPEPPTPQRMAMNIRPPSPGAGAVHNLAEEYNPPVGSTSHGHVRVQLAALRSQQAALHEWAHLTHRMPTLFDGRRPIFVEAHVDGHIFWRVRTAGFVSVTDATRFCSDVRAQGAACTVASF